MSGHDMLNAFKEGIKGELDSIHLYESAAARSAGEVKEFFLERAEEEKKHYNFLLAYYASVEGGGDIQVPDLSGYTEYSPVITRDFLKRISSDKYLFSAISTAVLLEMNAINHYRNSSEEAESEDAGKFFAFLTAWEKEHYESLLSIQEEAERHYWTENRFEPF